MLEEDILVVTESVDVEPSDRSAATVETQTDMEYSDDGRLQQEVQRLISESITSEG